MCWECGGKIFRWRGTNCTCRGAFKTLYLGALCTLGPDLDKILDFKLIMKWIATLRLLGGRECILHLREPWITGAKGQNMVASPKDGPKDPYLLIFVPLYSPLPHWIELISVTNRLFWKWWCVTSVLASWKALYFHLSLLGHLALE